MKNSKKGFTLVELLVVIAILAILATVAVVGYTSFIEKANESADIQAVTEMNSHLTALDIVDPVDSILDVYTYFEGSGLDVKGYKPLIEGRSYYYDKQYNQILYVDDETGKVIFPKEHENETQGAHDWFSLTMEIAKEEIAATVTEGVATYSVSSAEQYAYITELLSNDNDWPANDVVIELTGDIDFKGAYVAIDNVPYRKSLTIQSAGDAKYTMKNMTSDRGTYYSTNNSANENRLYSASALVGTLTGESTLTINNVVFSNLNVKATYVGNVGLLVASVNSNASVSFNNVEIKDSNVVGHRNVGALVGYTTWKVETTGVKMTNVTVGTVGGRSGLVVGFASIDAKGMNTWKTVDLDDDCNLYIYECAQNAGGIADITTTAPENATKKITSIKEENSSSKSSYGFNDKALYATGSYTFVLIED